MKVVRSSKPLGPFGSTRTTIGDTAVTRSEPTMAVFDGAAALAVAAAAEPNLPPDEGFRDDKPLTLF